MNFLILLGALTNNNILDSFMNEHLNDNNNYFVYSLDSKIELFEKDNFRDFRPEDNIKIEDLIILSESKYLRVKEDLLFNFDFMLEKFFDKIKESFYGYILIEYDAKIYKLTNKKELLDKIESLKELGKENYMFKKIPFELAKNIDFENFNCRVELTPEFKNYIALFKKYDLFILTSSEETKWEIISNYKVPNFAFYIDDLEQLNNPIYKNMFENKPLIFIGEDDRLVISSLKFEVLPNTIYQILGREIPVNNISSQNLFNHKRKNFIFFLNNNVNFSLLHTNSLYEDLRKEQMNCKAQSFIFSLIDKEQ